MKLILILLTATLGACASNNDLKWQSPNNTTELRHTKGSLKSSDQSSASYYSLHDISSGKQLVTAQSIITDQGSRTIYFSKTGNTVLIYEDLGGSSPEYSHTLLSKNTTTGNYGVRLLRLPELDPDDPDYEYRDWPDVVSITDESVTFRFVNDTDTQTALFKNLKDAKY